MAAIPLTEPTSDAELIESWKLGDETAATELVHRHAEAVARYLGAAGAGEDVDDLVQEAFFRAFRKIDTFKGEAQFRTWVIRIASNALKDQRRRIRGRVVLSIEDGGQLADGQGRPDEVLDARETERRVAAGIEELPAMQRDVFLLRAQHAVSYEDIAAVLGTTPGAARVHYHQAVKRLKELL